MFFKKKVRPITSVQIQVYQRMGESLYNCKLDARELCDRLGVIVTLRHDVKDVTFWPNGREVEWPKNDDQ